MKIKIGFYLISLLLAAIFFSSFVFSIGVSPESIVVEMEQDELYVADVIIYFSEGFNVEGEDDLIKFNLSECDSGRYCKGSVIIDGRYKNAGEYRKELFFYSDEKGNIDSGVRLPVTVNIKRADFNLIRHLKEDNVFVGMIGAMILLVVILGSLVFFR